VNDNNTRTVCSLTSAGIDLTEEISRVVGGRSGPKKDFYSATHTSTFKVSGRHILNIWRICRSEINLNQYSFENVVFHLLRQRCVATCCFYPMAAD
jgi:DNA polymerase elongation subunit (family B)